MDRTPHTARPGRRLSLLLALVVVLLLGSAAGAAPGSTLTATGELSIVWGAHTDDALGGHETNYFLMTSDEAIYQLQVSTAEQHVQLRDLDGQHVTVSGTLERAASPSGRALAVEGIAAAQGGEQHRAAPLDGSYPYLSLMCRFGNLSGEPRQSSFFIDQMTMNAPGMGHYFNEISYGAIDLEGSTALGWFAMPDPHSSYVFNGEVDIQKLAQDCTSAAAGATPIDFSQYHGVALMFNGSLGGAAFGGKIPLKLAGGVRSWPTVWMGYSGEANTAGGDLGWRGHGVLAHELGHSFGGGHSANSVGTTYGSSWDVLSNPQIGCGFNFAGGIDVMVANGKHATYGCIGYHFNADTKNRIGMLPNERKVIYDRETGPLTVTLDRLSQPLSPTSTLMAVVPYGYDFTGAFNKYYTIEARDQVGYDYKLPGSGVIIHSVQGRLDRSWIVAPPGAAQDSLKCVNCPNGTGGAAAVWAPGTTFTDDNHISISINSFDPETGQAEITINQVIPPPVPQFMPLLPR